MPDSLFLLFLLAAHQRERERVLQNQCVTKPFHHFSLLSLSYQATKPRSSIAFSASVAIDAAAGFLCLDFRICVAFSSFIEYFEGLTYEHVNFIFSGASHAQESSYPSTTNFYKFGLSEPDSTSYYRYNHGYDENHHHEPLVDEYRRPAENSTAVNEHTAAVNTEWGEGVNNTTRDNSIECPRRHHSNSNDYQVVWQDSIDPDNMTYEISMLPVSKYKCGFFSRKKSRDERNYAFIYSEMGSELRSMFRGMEYKRGDKRITLPCKHLYHASCGNRWLSINKACPICYREVF
ncbi:hypothetical protein PIB30_033908 [Stylosanthes scabra]|uniref:RING-type domain-containing protein n=1 Tax=Stylosanthes scabra TaxID=79078 RepID=A0ABU6WAN3_9FABA|nr:hypothetical protein [Stylosanthes scabra]